MISIGIVGARGYVGSELVGLIAHHSRMRLAYVASRSQAGKPVPVMGGGWNAGMEFVDASPSEIGRRKADVVVLAVPDGATGAYIDALPSDAVVLDLSSDHRFDDTWVYGLTEHNETKLRGATRISNPGCYATAVQLAVRPLLGVIEGGINAFGVSGYSGAGTTPSSRNNPDTLAGGITPYGLVGHTHEREITRHLGLPVRFSPHVAPYFRGITVTVQARTREQVTVESLARAYVDAYGRSRIIRVLGEQTPRVQEIEGDPGAEIGGITVGADGKDIAIVCTVDNLLKGAASQAIQNINVAFDMPSELGFVEGNMP